MTRFSFKLLSLLLVGSLVFFSSCKEEEEPDKKDASFSTNSESVAENGSAVTITINFDDELEQDGTITISYTTTGTYGSDFTTSPDGASGSFELSASSGEQFKSFSATPVDNSALGSADVTVTFTISSSTGGIEVGTGSTLTLTIEDDEGPSAVDFDAAESSVAEDGSAIMIDLSMAAAPAAGSFNVNWTSSAGAYTTDFTTDPDGSSGSFTVDVAESATSASFGFTPVDNDEAAENKTVVFTLSNFSGGVAAGTTTQTHTVTIENDDAAAMTLPYMEDFNDCGTSLPTEWMFMSLASDADWECTDDTRGISEEAGDYAIEANGFGGSEAADDWAISPAIDLGTNPTKMRFYSLKRFDDAEDGLRVLISNDFNGVDPNAATWTELNAELDSNNGDFDYEYTGDIDLSAHQGVNYVAFHYTTTGTGGGTTEQWRIDQLSIVEGLPATVTLTEAITDFGSVDNGANSASQSFTLSGANLEQDVSVVASNNYEVSLDDAAFSSEVTLAFADLNAGPVTVYVRFSPSSGFDQTVNGTITLSSPEIAGEGVIDVSGTETGNSGGGGTVVQFNEIHYDNTGADTGEFLEVVVTGTDIAANELANYRVVRYNGSDGNYYTDANLEASSETLDNFTRTEDSGNFYYVWETGANGLQNGNDALALVGPGGLIQFISYEGAFVGNEGAAQGVTATDILVSEPSDAPVGSSVQRKADGTWEYTPGSNTKGAKNVNE